LQIRNIARVSATALLLSFVTTSGVSAQETKAMSAQELNERTVQRRAVEAAIWGDEISLDLNLPHFLRLRSPVA
jgi:hypothetical protein